MKVRCALLFLLVMALERGKRSPSTSGVAANHGCVRQVFFVSCTKSLARMKGRSVSPLLVKTQRTGLGMFCRCRVADAWSCQKDYGMSPTTQSKHRSAGKPSVTSTCTKRNDSASLLRGTANCFLHIEEIGTNVRDARMQRNPLEVDFESCKSATNDAP